MGATFSRVKTWVAEILGYADLNAEFDNILTNLTPAGIDDLSVSNSAMQGQTDPYPASVISLSTSLSGELQRLRYQLAQITGNTYWYEDVPTTLLALQDIFDHGQWVPVTVASLTYVNATQFTVATDKTPVFLQGTRIKATVTAGTVYGTIKTSVYSSVTTVTVDWDSESLDAGLSAVSLGIISVDSSSLAIRPVITKTDDYTLTKADLNKTIKFNKGTAVSGTIPAATTIPSGAQYRIINVGAGVLTLAGTINGIANPTLQQYEESIITSDGTVWTTGLRVPRVTTITSSATPAINTDNCDSVNITALAAAITSMTSSLTGSPLNFQKLTIRIKDDGTARAIAWGASFEAKGCNLPASTVAGKVTTVTLIYDSIAAKWGCTNVAEEGAVGSVVQVVNYQRTNDITSSSQIPYDDTAPQITEGAEILTRSITPKNSSNILLIMVNAALSSDAGSTTMALFRTGTSSALNSSSVCMYGGSVSQNYHMIHYVAAGSTSALTFSVRCGGTGGSWTLNGAKYNDTLTSSITIMEIQA
jgi:hypothetical protein